MNDIGLLLGAILAICVSAFYGYQVWFRSKKFKLRLENQKNSRMQKYSFIPKQFINLLYFNGQNNLYILFGRFITLFFFAFGIFGIVLGILGIIIEMK